MDNLNITLTEEFTEQDLDGFTKAFDSSKVAVFLLKESVEEYPQLEGIDFEQYKQAVLEANKERGATEVKEEDGLSIIEYDFENPETKEVFSYLTTMHQEKEGVFWLVQFGALKENYEDLRPTMMEWAKKVTFQK